MKIIIRTLFCGMLCLTASSCEKNVGDFLNKAPGVDVTENTIFSSQTQLETFIAGTYRFGLHSCLNYNDAALTPAPASRVFTINAGITDEAEAEVTFFHPQAWNTASTTAIGNLVGGEDTRYFLRWTVIRNCNIILERIDEVPGLTTDYKNQVLGEAKFIRALNYFDMLKRYGGVPLLNKRLLATEDINIPRSTVEQIVNFIVKDCEEAVTALPATYPTVFRGRITKTAAQMLKARTLLYAASPLFNTGSPYLSLGGENDKLICYGNSDNNRWQLAADAAKEVLDNLAPAGNFRLITDKGATKNYKFAWEQNDNSEIVLAEKAYGPRRQNQFPWLGIQPLSIINSWGGVGVTHNFVRKYEKKDGTPQTWEGGNDLLKKYGELDNRFAQTVGYVGSFWSADVPILETFRTGRHSNNCVTGAWMKKLVPDAITTAQTATPNGIIFRLAEAYLNYAEALNELKGPVDEAYTAVNTIRDRSGMPPLPAGLSKEEFRARVRNERDIELAFEDHRLWDIRRWLIAENDGVMQGDMWGLRIEKIAASTEYKYTPYVFEPRTFLPRMYLHPFLNTEVFKGYLVQNPGW